MILLIGVSCTLNVEGLDLHTQLTFTAENIFVEKCIGNIDEVSFTKLAHKALSRCAVFVILNKLDYLLSISI